MKTIKFFEIAKHIPELEYDGDNTDLRLHSYNHINWGAKGKRDYKKAEKEIDNISFSDFTGGKVWRIYGWYDVSGFDYWMKKMEEQNYIQLSVIFGSEDIAESEIEHIRQALYYAIDKATEIADKYDFNPSSY